MIYFFIYKLAGILGRESTNMMLSCYTKRSEFLLNTLAVKDLLYC